VHRSPLRPRSGRLAATLLALVLAAAACTSGGGATTTTVTSDTTAATSSVPSTTEPTTTTIPPSSIPGTASPSLDPKVVAEMRGEVAALMGVAEGVRGLPFLQTPPVTILDRQAFADRVGKLVAEDLDADRLAADARFYTLMGMLPPGTDLYRLLIDLYTEQVAGFYDGDAKEMVVPAAPDGFTPLQKITIVHELVHALTDQHFDFNDEYQRRNDEGNGDDASAMAALVEGDATYFQFVYMESLSPLEAAQAATEALGLESSRFDAAPEWIRRDLLFPYDQGLTFVQSLVADGGIARVDQAYQDLPDTTEQILHPARYLRREDPLALDPVDAAPPGWEVHDEGSLGEWGLRQIFAEALRPGEATQAAAGWGNDHYQVLTRGDDVAVALHYVGESRRDAEEVADALIAQAKGPMGAGASRELDGGLVFDRGTVYVFIDRVEDEVYFVASTDLAAGPAIKARLEP